MAAVMQTLKQLIKFGLVGMVSFTIDFGTYTFLTRMITSLQEYYVLVSVFTSALAIVAAYIIHHHWTFRQTEKMSTTIAGRYLLVTVSGLLLQNGLLLILVERGQINDLFAKLLAVVIIGGGWNFIWARSWVFRVGKMV